MELSAPSAASSASPRCEERLSDCGIRPTAQRVRIAALLLSAPQHLSAEQILASLRAAGARVSKATVYNTLNRSEEHTSELQSHSDLVCRLLLEKKNKAQTSITHPSRTH